ncbi:MAG: Uma2 family endonuclease [Acidobacteria bacterium]|nr:Uma2 family endonuclease [Acidobacteriota bacterium]
MTTLVKQPLKEDIVYPESDGKPMSENTKQYEWIVTIKENLEALLPNAFIAADLFWYPVQNRPRIVQAPDVMVAIGRPKGHRGSYKQWEEGNIAPQVVFEILSPSNSGIEILRKLEFYRQYGVGEYYVYDPETEGLFGYTRLNDSLQAVENISGWVSLILGIRFEPSPDGLAIYYPDGRRFLTFQELLSQAENERQRAENERQRAENEHQRAENERQRAEKLAAKLREMGIDPTQI